MNVIQFIHHHKPWTEERICDLYCWALDGATLAEMAERMGCSSAECDLALWSMVGHDSDEAADVMNRRYPK